MSLSTVSAVILIIGAIAIIAFVIHGLWFSEKAGNRRLRKDNGDDAKILDAKNVGKVRIVTADAETSKIQIEDSPKSDSADNTELENEAFTVRKSYDFNVVANADRPFVGTEIENLMNEYGFVRGNMDIYYVYEDPSRRLNEVFRICSLKAPYSFPADMRGFTTPAMALFMNLPERGKGIAYIRAMRMAANLFAQNLGGTIQDNHHNIITDEDFDKMEEALAAYDAGKDPSDYDDMPASI